MLSEFRIDRCGLLKLDGEGAEYQIIYGAPPEIWSRIDRIALEYHGLKDTPANGSGEALADYLKSVGYLTLLRPHTRHPRKGMLYCVRIGT